MRRQRLRWAVGLIVVALVAAGALVLWPRSSRVTRENFRLIRVGMSRAEVEAILGPPGDYANGDTKGCGTAGVRDHESVFTAEAYLLPQSSAWHGDWHDDRILIQVDINREGKVFSAFCQPLQTVDHGPLGNLRWRAKRQGRKWFPE